MKYEELPSTAIDYMELDFDSSVVKVVYKSNSNKQYGYKCEDLDEFQSAFMILCGKLELNKIETMKIILLKMKQQQLKEKMHLLANLLIKEYNLEI